MLFLSISKFYQISIDYEAKWVTVRLKLRKQSEDISSSETAKNYEIE